MNIYICNIFADLLWVMVDFEGYCDFFIPLYK